MRLLGLKMLSNIEDILFYRVYIELFIKVVLPEFCDIQGGINVELIRKKNSIHSMELKSRNGVSYLQFPEFEKTGLVKHLFSTRAGGVSEGYLGTMNLSYSRGDKKENVDENFRRISEILDCPLERFVLSAQTHTTNIRIVSKEDGGKGIFKKADYTDVDGLITNEKNLVLSTFFADCVPLFLLDTKRQVIALSHSGWRGTVGKIGEKTIEIMCSEFGSEKKDIITAIGPSICKDCYEVGPEVAKAFYDIFSKEQTDKIVYPKKAGHYQLDLWQANYQIFLDAGLQPQQICTTDICTSCNKENLFSHRASNGKRGNLGAFMMLT